MINAEVVKAVQELLTERGERQREGEKLADFVARSLHLSGPQTEIFLEAVHDGATVDEAAAAAGFEPAHAHEPTLHAIARTIGRALGRASSLKAM